MLKFLLYDFVNDDGTTAVAIDEPVGFDGAAISLIRDRQLHGVMAEVDKFTYDIDGEGYRIIKAAYDSKGLDARVDMAVLYQCEQDEECAGCLKEIFRGTVLMATAVFYCGDECKVRIQLERKGCYMAWRNAMETKVNLLDALSVDKSTPLVPYDWLPFQGTLPAKTIILKNKAKSLLEGVVGGWRAGGDPVPKYKFFPVENVILDEVQTFQPNATSSPELLDSQQDDSHIPVDLAFFKMESTSGLCLTDGTYQLSVKINSLISTVYAGDENNLEGAIFYIRKYDLDGNYVSTVYSQVLNIVSPVPDPYGGLGSEAVEVVIDTTLTVPASPPHCLMMYVWTNYDTYLNTGLGTPIENWINLEAPEITMTFTTACPDTPCKLFMVNEAGSRIVESVTNDCMRMYSSHYGRTNSQPYSTLANGCGSLKALTKGLFIRQLDTVATEDTQPIFAISFQELLQALDAIEAIGVGIEPDPYREGQDIVRMEPVEYFYQDAVVLDLGTVALTRKADVETWHHNNLKIGYEKWEAEEYNGLDEFLTQREYNTGLVQNKATLEKLCQFIASGYAIEVTRRKGYDNTKDWRYDEDTFIICVKRPDVPENIEVPYVVEQGIDLGIVASNLIDPDTVYNARISPARMALRWFNLVLSFLKQWPDARLIFTNGEGNIHAAIELNGTCLLEAGTLSEKQTIDLAAFLNAPVPIFKPEVVEMTKIPLAYADFIRLKDNPHGLLAYKCADCPDCDTSYGWIKEVTYYYAEGEADIKLYERY